MIAPFDPAYFAPNDAVQQMACSVYLEPIWQSAVWRALPERFAPSACLRNSFMVPVDEIHKLAKRIAREFDPECIILFGSYASGCPTADSDVDLLVILPFSGKPFWKSLEIMNRVNAPFPLDLLARRPDDTLRRQTQGDPLIRDALSHGRILYERGH